MSSSASEPPLLRERALWAEGFRWIAGVDEVGRGPLAGPVFAAAVILAPGMMIEGADDSKRLKPIVRERLSLEILERAEAVGIGAASVREIERYNILHATTRAMQRALAHLRIQPDRVLVDGLPVRGLGIDHEAVVGGDGCVHCIACASIVAKVCRDGLMQRLARRYPEYLWERNMGYGTSAHREALRRCGPTAHHRRTFAGVQVDLELS